MNGTWDGLVGMLGRGEADIVLANLFVANVKGRTEFQEYTFPHGQEVGAHQFLWQMRVVVMSFNYNVHSSLSQTIYCRKLVSW